MNCYHKEYEREQTELEQSIAQLQAELDSCNADSAKANKFIELVKKYPDFSELTPQMIAEYIEKIVVHEADKTSGERAQQVDIYLNFIGKFEVPMPEPTAEEIAAEEKARRKREQRREAQRQYAAKQKQKQQEQEEAARQLPRWRSAAYAPSAGTSTGKLKFPTRSCGS